MKSAQTIPWRGIVSICLVVSLAMLLLAVAFTMAHAARPADPPAADPPPEPVGEVITIGVAVPVPLDFGWQELNAVQLAVSQTNQAGGLQVGGITYTLALVEAYDNCDPTQAITAAQTLLDAGVVAVVGHGCSGSVMAVQPLYAGAGVAMVSPSSTSMLISQKGYTNTFRVASNDATPMRLLAGHIAGWLGLQRAAIVILDGYPDFWVDVYSQTITALGGEITSIRVVTETSSYTPTMEAIKHEDHPEALFVHDFWPGNAGLLSKAAHNVGMDDVVVGWYSGGMGAVEIDQYAQAAGAAAEGDIASMLFRRFEDMPGWADFMADYQAAGFDHMPDYPDVFGAYAYDAAGILFAAIQQAGSVDPEAIRLAIAATQDYPGVVCQYEGFDDHGDAIPQLAWMMNYRAGAWADMHPTRVYLPVTVK